METATRVARDRHLILHGLEVLRLIGDCMERKHDVDAADMDLVLTFMRQVAHPSVADSHLPRIEILFNEMIHAHKNGDCETFLSLAQSYTALLVPGVTQPVLTDELARQHSLKLHQLEVKYTSPHCI